MKLPVEKNVVNAVLLPMTCVVVELTVKFIVALPIPGIRLVVLKISVLLA